MKFTSEENKEAFRDFIEHDSYTKHHRGEYSKRGAKVAPWQNRFNVKVAQDFKFNVAGHTNTLTLGVDIINFANLLNSDWGLSKQISRENILTYKNGVYTFNKPVVNTYKNVYNTWQMLLSAKLSF